MPATDGAERREPPAWRGLRVLSGGRLQKLHTRAARRLSRGALGLRTLDACERLHLEPDGEGDAEPRERLVILPYVLYVLLQRHGGRWKRVSRSPLLLPWLGLGLP